MNLADSTKPPGEAVNADGTLKDARDMTWINDPDDDVDSEADQFPIGIIRSTTTSTPSAPSAAAIIPQAPIIFTFAPPITSNPESRKRRGTESANQSAPPPKKTNTAKSAKPSGSTGNTPTAKQPQPIDRVQPLTTVVTAATASGQSSETAPEKKKRNATADIYTVFTKDEATDEHICSVCLCVTSNIFCLDHS